MRRTTWCLLALSLLVSAFSLPAQERKSAVDTVTYRLREMIVTAERKETSPIESPLAITTVTGRDLEMIRGYGLDDALLFVPGVLTQSRYGNQDIRLTIRGFGARGAGERSNAGTSRGIRVLTDGFPETEPDGRTSFDLIDLESAGRIEVVRSNASALWGNASGGVVQLSTNADFSRPFSRIASSFGSFGFRRDLLQAGSNVGVGKLFVSLSNTTFDGWREHSNSSQTLFTGVLAMPLAPATRLLIQIAGTSNFFRIPGPLTLPQFEADPRQAQSDTMNYKPTYVQRDERRFNRLGRIGVSLTHGIDESSTVSAMIFASPKVLQRSERNTFRDFNRYHLGGNFVYQLTMRLSDQLQNSLLAGVDEAYQDGTILFYTLVNGGRGTGPQALQQNKREGANSGGIFLQNELNIGDKLTLLLGGRYDDITYFYESFIDPRANTTKSFHRLTPKAGISYRFNPFHSLYANIGGGVEVPAGNETDPPATFGQDTLTAINPLLEPISSTTFELGTKQILIMDASHPLQALQYDAAIYLIEVRDDIIPYSGGRFYFTAGRTQRTGFEAGAQAWFTGGFSLQGAFTLSKNIYRDYLVDSVHYKKPGSIADYSGKKIAGLPQYFYTAQLSYSPPWLEHLYLSLAVRGTGNYYADDANTLSVDPYTIISATVGLRDLSLWDDHLVLRGFITIQNLLDASYAASVYINPDYDRNRRYAMYLEPGLPRNLAGSISLAWNF